jgi:hypothetical protein
MLKISNKTHVSTGLVHSMWHSVKYAILMSCSWNFCKIELCFSSIFNVKIICFVKIITSFMTGQSICSQAVVLQFWDEIEHFFNDSQVVRVWSFHCVLDYSFITWFSHYFFISLDLASAFTISFGQCFVWTEIKNMNKTPSFGTDGYIPWPYYQICCSDI